MLRITSATKSHCRGSLFWSTDQDTEERRKKSIITEHRRNCLQCRKELMITYSKTASSSSEQQKSNPRIQGDERRRFSTLEEQAKVQKKKA
jgi:predicted anti-sigma-YlaC factor YlaD